MHHPITNLNISVEQSLFFCIIPMNIKKLNLSVIISGHCNAAAVKENQYADYEEITKVMHHHY